jgi:hypothetical protein
MELHSKLEMVVMHYKDSEPVAMTHSNGHQTLYKLAGEMGRKEIEEFYETQKQIDHGADKQEPVR